MAVVLQLDTGGFVKPVLAIACVALSCGACSKSPTATASPSAQDPAPDRGRWEARSPLPAPRWGAGVVAHEGEIWVIGGGDDDATVSTTFRYDPGQDAWSRGTELPKPLFHPAAVSWGGTVLVIAGNSGDRVTHGESAVYAWDAMEDAWVWHSDLPSTADWPLAASVDGQVVATGLAPAQEDDPTAWLDSTSREWRLGPPVPFITWELESGPSDPDGVWAVGRIHIAHRDPANGAWTHVGFREDQVPLGAAVLGGRLHLLNRLTNATSHSSWSVDGTSISMERPPDSEKRSQSMAVALDGRLYLLGGQDAPDQLTRVTLRRMDVFIPPG